MKFSEIGDIVDASEFRPARKKKMKATIWRTGRIGFTKEASERMGFTKGSSLLIVTAQKDWYVKVVKDDSRGFPLRIGSGYYSFDAKGVLVDKGINYADQEHTYIFDVSQHGRDDADGAIIWCFKLRTTVTQRRQK